IECPTCAKSVEGPQELTEETGPRLAELLRVTRNQGRWKAQWDMLSERKSAVWGVWRGSHATKKRKEYKERVEQDSSKPTCPKCSAAMRIIRPRPTHGSRFGDARNSKSLGAREAHDMSRQSTANNTFHW